MFRGGQPRLASRSDTPHPACGARQQKEERTKNMTPDQVKLVQQSFTRVAPISEQAAVLFYDRLFEVAPSVKVMFPDD